MNSIVLIALGSGLGGVVRYMLSGCLNSGRSFPVGTLLVNVLGSLAIGLLSGWLSRHTGNAEAVRSFAIIGFCGGFTTFSTFSNESFLMLEQGQWGALFVYVGLSVMAGLGAVALGYLMMRYTPVAA